MITIPRLVIAGTHSGVGKTSIATGLMAALTRRGIRVQPFKIGPDFIDPGFHRLACGRTSRNLDGWMLSRHQNLEIFARAALDADIAVIEGVMGLFDRSDATSEAGSTAEVAKWLRAPVILVADASAMACSAAAVVNGFENFDPELELPGVLFNFIGGAGHAELLKKAVCAHCRARTLGFLPRYDGIALPERHLGLVMAHEILTPATLARMAHWVEANVDLDALLALARERPHAIDTPLVAPRRVASKARIGVARDAAFCFYYQDNLDLLAECGAEIVEFSPIADDSLPSRLDGLYLCGGYPEIYAGRLSQNRPMRNTISQFAKSRGPIYAECGGFMYLTEAIIDCEGREFPMAGLFPTRVRMQKQLAAIAYVEGKVTDDVLWLRAGQKLRGHEYHYSTIDDIPLPVTHSLQLCANGVPQAHGFTTESTLAGYTHFHFYSSPEFAYGFVAACSAYRNRMRAKVEANA